MLVVLLLHVPKIVQTSSFFIEHEANSLDFDFKAPNNMCIYHLTPCCIVNHISMIV